MLKVCPDLGLFPQFMYLNLTSGKEIYAFFLSFCDVGFSKCVELNYGFDLDFYKNIFDL